MMRIRSAVSFIICGILLLNLFCTAYAAPAASDQPDARAITAADRGWLKKNAVRITETTSPAAAAAGQIQLTVLAYPDLTRVEASVLVSGLALVSISENTCGEDSLMLAPAVNVNTVTYTYAVTASALSQASFVVTNIEAWAPGASSSIAVNPQSWLGAHSAPVPDGPSRSVCTVTAPAAVKTGDVVSIKINPTSSVSALDGCVRVHGLEFVGANGGSSDWWHAELSGSGAKTAVLTYRVTARHAAQVSFELFGVRAVSAGQTITGRDILWELTCGADENGALPSGQQPAGPAPSPVRYRVSIEGPEEPSYGEQITIYVDGCGDATSGRIETDGLRVVSAKGGFSSLTDLVVMRGFGGLRATYVCEVTAPAGSACRFGVTSVLVSDPDANRDVTAPPAEWTRTVVARQESPSPAPAQTVPSSPAQTAPLTWMDALLDNASQSTVIYWDDVCMENPEATHSVYVGDVFTSQTSTWEDHGQLMFDAGLLVVPYNAAGDIIEPDDQHSMHQATGQHMYVKDLESGEIVSLHDIVMMGDVTGSGELGISQLVCLAQAVSGARPLTGLYAQAGDVNNSGRLDLSDLIVVAAWLSGRYVAAGSGGA